MNILIDLLDMISKLLATSDGKIPFLQILIGLIVGAIGMIVYVKFKKPDFIFGNSKNNFLNRRNRVSSEIPVVAEETRIPQITQVPTIFNNEYINEERGEEAEEEAEEESEVEEEEEEEEDMAMRRQSILVPSCKQ